MAILGTIGKYAKKFGPQIAGAATTILGSRMKANKANESSQWTRQMNEAEIARRNQMQGLAMPSMMQGLGYRGKNVPLGSTFQKAAAPILQPGGGSMPSGSSVSGVPQAGGSKVGKVLGTAGAGIGAASALGFGALGGPIGLAAGGAAMLGGAIANKVGAGRRMANQNTGEGGPERQFSDILTQMSAQGGDPADLKAAYQNYSNQMNAWIAAGGNQAKIARQSLANAPLQDTYQRLLAQLEGRT